MSQRKPKVSHFMICIYLHSFHNNMGSLFQRLIPKVISPAFASPWGFGVGWGPRGSGPWGTHSSAPQEAAPTPSLPSGDPGMGAPRPRGPGQRHGDREADVREQEVTVPEPAGDARPPVASDSAQATGSGRRPPQRPGALLRSPTATPPPQEAPSFTRSGVQADCAPLARSRVLCKPRV